MRVLHLIVIAFCVALQSSNAQVARISGVVQNTENQPLDGAIVSFRGELIFTDEKGKFNFEVPANRKTKLHVSMVGYAADSATVNPKPGESLFLTFTLKASNNVLTEVEIIDREQRAEGGTKLNARELEFNTGPMTTVEGLIRSLPGVVIRSEFSSQYNVRGGTFDENLIYVNGIEIYRPVLARSGQQEGLSFVNSDMVSDIYFSAGGYAARYGDKMSSVLDIKYREPEPFGMRVQASLLGVNVTAEGRSANNRLGAIGSFRYRNNQVLLGSTDLTADFQPQFTDVQTLITYQFTDEFHVEFLGNYGRNNFRVEPQTAQTRFGTLQEALQLNIFFEGHEQYFYTTVFGALKGSWYPRKNITLDFISSAYQTVENELTDVIGYYRLAELNNNLGSDNFGDIALVRGVGAFQNYMRNSLDAIVLNLEHQGQWINPWGTVRWGARLQHDNIADRYKEWERIDSAGYSVTHNPTRIDSIINGQIFFTPTEGLELWKHFDTRANAISNRYMGYGEIEKAWFQTNRTIRMVGGVRGQLWTWSGQFTLSPRLAISMTQNNKTWRLSGGWYHQHPFYREFRNIEGETTRDIRAQLAIHAVAGLDYSYEKWGKPFKFSTELYYKAMNHLIPYEIDNVRLRYSAVNNAVGYAAGIDMRLNGEFVKGTESWGSLSLFRVMENIEADSAGFIPRPTDTRFSFAIFFQDYLRTDPSFRVSLNLFVTGGFPFGPPGSERKEQIFRAPPYRRVDIGFIKVLKEEGKESKMKALNHFRSMWVGLEVFNLLQSRNAVSYLWVRDVSTTGQYAVPNYLTARLLNLKLTFKI